MSPRLGLSQANAFVPPNADAFVKPFSVRSSFFPPPHTSTPSFAGRGASCRAPPRMSRARLPVDKLLSPRCPRYACVPGLPAKKRAGERRERAAGGWIWFLLRFGPTLTAAPIKTREPRGKGWKEGKPHHRLPPPLLLSQRATQRRIPPPPPPSSDDGADPLAPTFDYDLRSDETTR